MKRPRVLLVDDDRSVLEALGGVIEAEGFEVVRAADGHEALQQFRQQSMDIVLLDLNMPVKAGWDTFEGLTTVNPLLPIIIITARADANSEAATRGIASLMQKPLDIPLLLEKMRDLLSKRAVERFLRVIDVDPQTPQS
jgi:DNA-binding response OmpR family regulator